MSNIHYFEIHQIQENNILYLGLWTEAGNIFNCICDFTKSKFHCVQLYLLVFPLNESPDSIVSIVTHYGLDGPGIESLWGARFFAPVQYSSESHPVSYTIRTGSYPGVKRLGRGVDHPPHLVLMLNSKAIPLLLFWAFVACSRVNFTFTFTSK